MKKIFKYYLKDRLKLVITFSVVAILFTLCCVLTEKKYFEYTNEIPLTSAIVPIFIFIFIVPIYEFSFKMKKTHLDLYYSLPIRKEHLYFSKLLLSFIETIIPFVLSLFTFLILMGDVMTSSQIGYIFLFLPFGIIFICTAISLISFIFTLQNSLLDGIVLTFAYCFIPYLFMLTVLDGFLPINVYDIAYGLTFIAPFSKTLSVIEDLINNPSYRFTFDTTMYACIVPFFLSIAAFICTIIYNSKIKAEKTNTISNHLISYKFIIPCITLCFWQINDLFIFFIVLIYLMCCLYQKTLLLKKKHQLIYFGSVVAFFITSMIVLNLFFHSL